MKVMNGILQLRTNASAEVVMRVRVKTNSVVLHQPAVKNSRHAKSIAHFQLQIRLILENDFGSNQCIKLMENHGTNFLQGEHVFIGQQYGQQVSVPVVKQMVNANLVGRPITPDLSVIQERVPAGSGEVRHFHSKARQYFYVLSGQATLEFDDGEITFSTNQGVHVAPGVHHRFKNAGDTDVVFIVISSPSTEKDRLNLVDLVAQCDMSATECTELRDWNKILPVGREV